MIYGAIIGTVTVISVLVLSCSGEKEERGEGSGEPSDAKESGKRPQKAQKAQKTSKSQKNPKSNGKKPHK